MSDEWKRFLVSGAASELRRADEILRAFTPETALDTIARLKICVKDALDRLEQLELSD